MYNLECFIALLDGWLGAALLIGCRFATSSMRLINNVSQICRVFSSASIHVPRFEPALPIKVAAITQRVFGEPDQRPFGLSDGQIDVAIEGDANRR